MKPTRDEMKALAAMSALSLSDKELDRYAGDIETISAQMERVELLTSDIEPTAPGAPMEPEPDETRPSLARITVLQQAPDPREGLFRFPPVMQPKQDTS
jgi:aspartyl-tRNA(Asn)/glutamyl-tRNA(Gln) amidotransferase subunit C